MKQQHITSLPAFGSEWRRLYRAQRLTFSNMQSCTLITSSSPLSTTSTNLMLQLRFSFSIQWFSLTRALNLQKCLLRLSVLQNLVAIRRRSTPFLHRTRYSVCCTLIERLRINLQLTNFFSRAPPQPTKCSTTHFFSSYFISVNLFAIYESLNVQQTRCIFSNIF